jgi:putative DNA primase/helicase
VVEAEGGLTDFVSFARAHGLRIDHAVPDGRWHRTATDDKPRKKNGAYLFDGQRGVVKNFATMERYAAYRDGANVGFVDRAELRARRAVVQAETSAKQAEARARAEDMVRRATVDKHPYLAAKGFPAETGLVLDGELLIPMREFKLYRQINSLQRISADGTKLFLAGGKAKGSVFFIGPYMARERWLVEGYATGLSVRAALRDLHCDAQIVVCFSAGNLAYIGRLVKELRPKAFVFADNDKSGAGAEAAKSTGLPFCMAMFEGMDANDWHREYGVRSLADLIQDTRRLTTRRQLQEAT